MGGAVDSDASKTTSDASVGGKIHISRHNLRLPPRSHDQGGRGRKHRMPTVKYQLIRWILAPLLALALARPLTQVRLGEHKRDKFTLPRRSKPRAKRKSADLAASQLLSRSEGGKLHKNNRKVLFYVEESRRGGRIRSSARYERLRRGWRRRGAALTPADDNKQTDNRLTSKQKRSSPPGTS